MSEQLDFMEHDLETSIKMLTHISLDPKIPLLEIYSTYVFPQIHSNISIEIYSVMFTASFFTIAESWKQLKCPQGVD